jgi:hypothetical protein
VNGLKSQSSQRLRKGFRFHGFRMLVAAVVILITTEMLLIWSQNTFLRTTVADWGSIEHAISSDLLILRKESVLVSPIDGIVYPLVNAGSRVRRGEPVLEVVNTRWEQKLTPEMRKELSHLSSQTAILAYQLQGVERELIERRKQKEYLKRKDPAGKELRQVESEINQLLGELSRISRKREDLLSNNERMNLDGSQNYVCLVATEPGVFWPALDGGESLSDDTVYLPQEEDFTKNYKPSSPVLEKRVRAGQALGKVINGWEETVIAKVGPVALQFRPKEGMKYGLVLPDGQRSELKFQAHVLAQKGEFWIFQEKSLNSSLLKKRKLRGAIIARKSTGIRLPRTALVERSDGWKAITMRRGQKREIPVKVVDTDDSWAIVQGVSLGTLILYH